MEIVCENVNWIEQDHVKNLMARFCDDKGSFRFHDSEQFLDLLNNYQLLKEYSLS
jgi:hypothetical protein